MAKKSTKRAAPITPQKTKQAAIVVAAAFVLLVLIIVAGVMTAGEKVLASRVLHNPDREEAWQMDLAFFRRELPASHPDLFVLMTKSEFLAAMDELVLQVPHKTDEELTDGLDKILRTLGDPRTGIRREETTHYPLQLFELEEGVFVEGIAEALLNTEDAWQAVQHAQLLSVNGMAVAEIRSRAETEYLIGGNPSYLSTLFCEVLTSPGSLKKMGIIQQGDPMAFEFLLADGRTVEMAVRPVPVESTTFVYAWEASGNIARKNADKPYWFEVMDNQAVYFRINQCQEDPSQPFTEMVDQVMAAFTAEGMESARLLVDFRGSRGGERKFIEPLSKALSSNQSRLFSQVFTIVGRNMQAESVEAALMVGGTLVGERMGTGHNYFYDIRTLTLSNTGIVIEFPLKQVNRRAIEVQPNVTLPTRYSYFTKDDFIAAALAEDPWSYEVEPSAWPLTQGKDEKGLETKEAAPEKAVEEDAADD